MLFIMLNSLNIDRIDNSDGMSLSIAVILLTFHQSLLFEGLSVILITQSIK